MPAYLRIILMSIMAAGFLFGFLDILIPLNFERLHVFLFNMTVGGFVILHYTRGEGRPSAGLLVYLALGAVYAVLAFFNRYGIALAAAVPMWAIVEKTRTGRFSFFPKNFFRNDAPVERKFHEAALLCLSLSFVFSTVVVMNTEFFHWFTLDKLKPDVFFLGFSFPVSLITMSVMFRYIGPDRPALHRLIENGIFWTINIGVIIFFVFIIFGLFAAEVAAASVLFVAVIFLFVYFLKYGAGLKQKHFLISGMVFLLFTAFTGLLYIPAKAMGMPPLPELLLKSHAYISLYGWNLSGLFVITRREDFPFGMNSWKMILLHWTVIVLAPAGKYVPAAVPFICAAFIVLLYRYFFAREKD